MKMLGCANIENFSNNSTIHGFRELFHAKSLIWKIIWFAVIGASMGLSIFQLFKRFRTAIDEPTTTNIKPLSMAMKYPQLSFCYFQWPVWYNWSISDDLGYDKESAFYGASLFDDIISSDYLNYTRAKGNFISLMNKNGFARVSDFYFAISTDKPPGFIKSGGINFTKRLDTASFGTLCYVASSKSIEEAFSKEFVGINTIELVYFAEHRPHTHITAHEMLAYQAFAFQTKVAAKSPSFTANSSDDGKRGVLIVSPRIKFDDTDTNWILIEEGTYQIHVTISSNVNIWLDNGNPACNKDPNITQHYSYCTIYCMHYANHFSNKCLKLTGAALIGVDQIENICEHKFRFLYNATSMKADHVPEQRAQSSPLYFNSCIEVYCKIPCTDWKHTSTVTKVVIPSAFSDVSLNTIITISYPSKSSVLEIEQALSQDWESLIGDIGGILGLWLGASVMSGIQMVYLLCCSTCDGKVSCDKQTNKTSNVKRDKQNAAYFENQANFSMSKRVDAQRHRSLQDIVFYPRN